MSPIVRFLFLVPDYIKPPRSWGGPDGTDDDETLHRNIGADAFAALLPAAAQAQQKKVVVYTSNESTLNDLVFAAFTKETGIAVEPVVAGSGVVIRRLQAEKERPLGDIVWGISRSLLQTNRSLFAPYASKNKDATPVEYRDPDRPVGRQ